ncbi:MAG: ADP-ribosylglycohydrolase family protein [Bacilli bacterium]|nr:ADP-ribosylglycohydrolase family protein [Bacilli bacterium]
MWGSIIGDIIGSIYEYEQIKKIKRLKNIKELITSSSFFSDDTILTIAIMDAIINDKNYEKYLREYGNKYIDYKPNFKPYFNTSFSPEFIKWLKNEKSGNSIGNGAMMRIAPIGYLFDDEQELLNNTKLATITSHNSKEAINCSTIITQVIFLKRNGYSKDEIIAKLNLDIKPSLFLKFNTTCTETINNCLYSVFTSNSYEESIRKILSFGGDTDTNACIVGGMAEALYGVDDILIKQAQEKIPKQFVKVLELGYKLIK